MWNGPIAQPADQTALTGGEQFLSTKPCLHSARSLIHIALWERKKAVYSVLQLVEPQLGVNGMSEQMLPSCGQGEHSLNNLLPLP